VKIPIIKGMVMKENKYCQKKAFQEGLRVIVLRGWLGIND
jgi:hypothetical protein